MKITKLEKNIIIALLLCLTSRVISVIPWDQNWMVHAAQAVVMGSAFILPAGGLRPLFFFPIASAWFLVTYSSVGN